MISAVVLTPDTWRPDDLARQREIVARSMVWLVSAVVAGIVRDVTLAVPARLGLALLADQSGCRLVEADDEPARLAAALSGCRQPRVLILKAGYQPDPGLIDEIDVLLRHDPEDMRAVLLEEPATLVQRLLPKRAAVAGVLVSRADASAGFGRLGRAARRRGTLFRARARPIS